MNEILNDLVQQAGNSAIKLVQLIEEQAPLLVHDLLVVRGIEQTAGLLAGLAIVGVAIVLAARSRKISQRLRLDSVDQLFYWIAVGLVFPAGAVPACTCAVKLLSIIFAPRAVLFDMVCRMINGG